ncbi:MAG: ABC transporter ATP-binding protein [Coriobacteriaceae bacterium]|nr:ABC transporter ATP-binding protein [Coriobacteriaceae bacterium]
MLFDARGITVTLPGDAGPCRVLDGVDLGLAVREIVDVVGPSGSGKTTLLRALARLLPGATGTLTLAGEPAESVEPHVWRTRVTLLPQRAAIVGGTVRDNLLLPWRLMVRAPGDTPADSVLRPALDNVGLDVDLDRDASRLSVGQAARVALLRVLLARPRVLLLDEPDASLDPASAEQVRGMTRAFAEDGGGVVRVRHQPSDDLASRRFRLEGGRLAEVGA